MECKDPVQIVLLWDEVLTGNDVPCMRTDTANLIHLKLEPGVHHFESFEPYTFRYVKLLCLAGGCVVSNVYLREYASPDMDDAAFSCSDPRMNRIFAAAVQTLRQNAADLLTDCSGRERAGWLCDTFFSGRAAFDLSGHTSIERKFLEDFLLAPQLPELPEGVIPMCYPADHPDGNFIPQWPLWLVLELREYLQRSGDRALVDAFADKVRAFLRYLSGFENTDGLIENLPGWNFVEWSAANTFTQGVNYPTNMLYASTLATAAELWGWEEMNAQCARIREFVRLRAYDGSFFVDNALREEGELRRTINRTEVCQYFAFFFDVATPDSHPELWSKLVDDFGPHRRQTKTHPEIHFANAFIGNYLRLDLLSRYGRRGQVVEEIRGYFLGMADTTGTLWENDSPSASCNHGFASYVVRWILCDLAGVVEIDTVARQIRIRKPCAGMQWVDLRLPLPGGQLTLNWRREKRRWLSSITAPEGFALQFD